MCGIAGIAGNERPWVQDYLNPVTDALSHRGPDDRGTWIHREIPLGLGHRRLSIVDLSPLGHQPMLSASGRYTITFNGEVFNFHDLRRALEQRGHRFRGTSDTEIMLAAFEQWGIADAVTRFVGMFAFAVWDEAEQCLTLARDRLGIKPLYYGCCDQGVLFSSELKSFTAHSRFPRSIDRNSVALLMRYCYIPAPHSIYDSVRKLPPGTLLPLHWRGGRWQIGAISHYWDALSVINAALADPFPYSELEAEEALDNKLREVIELRMIADVPLGAFLSGGIDSSTVVAIMQQLSPRPVKTFSIAFREEQYNEADHARAVADHLGTDHTELLVTAEQAQAVIPLLPTMYDEPFADSSQIPTYLVSKLARNAVTVSLSGDGGDELFCGYARYPLTATLWSALNILPESSRGQIRSGMLAIVARLRGRNLDAIEQALRSIKGPQTISAKIGKLAEVFDAPSDDDLYARVVSHWRSPEEVVIGAHEPMVAMTDYSKSPQRASYLEKMMYRDLVSYLPDDILTKVDRASMAVSLEARVPLLDHRLVEFAWRLPLRFKRSGRQGKTLLRNVLARYIPRQLFERPKMGFGVPIDAWLRGELREWAEDLLSLDRLKREGVLNPTPIRQKWQEHLSGHANWQYHLWDVLMFEAWLAEQR